MWSTGTLAYGDLLARADDLASRLGASGVGPGDRLAVAIGNRFSFPVAVLAGLIVRAAVAPVDPLLAAGEREALLHDLAPAGVVTEAAGQVAYRSGSSSRSITWSPADPSDACALVLYTSGTSGRPKGAMISAAALGWALESWARPVMRLTADDVVLAALPLSHSFGLNAALLAPLTVGATVVLVERFDPDDVAATLAARGITVCPGVATMFRRLLDVRGFAGSPAMRLAVSGAAPCPWDLAHDWRVRTGVRIVRGYGMTELFRPISCLADDEDDRPDAVGRAVPGVTVRLVTDDGRDARSGEEGELWVRSPAVMAGYLNAPDETRAVLAGGWFRTGDLATATADGFITITGRKRERILRGGHSVFPLEVETLLQEHPAVAEAAVVGVPDVELGEEVAAFVVLRDGHAAADRELIAWCRDRLARFKYPRQVTIMSALPRSSTGKVLKAQLVSASCSRTTSRPS